MKTKVAFLCTVFVIQLSSEVLATHLRSGQIIIEQVGPFTDRTYKITVQVFTKSKPGISTVLFGGEGDLLDFGDGTPQFNIPEQQNIPINFEFGISKASYTILHTYAGPGKYVVSYRERNRNESILNIDVSVNTPFYLESSFVIDPLIGPEYYQTPQFLAPPFFFGQAGKQYSFSLAAKDTNDFTLIYELSIPKQDRSTPVVNYRTPDNLTINMFNGLITWDGNYMGRDMMGEFLITAKISQFKDNVLMGYVIRDVQILMVEDFVEAEISDDTETNSNGRIFVDLNQTTDVEIVAEASLGTEVTLEAFSELGAQNVEFEVTTAPNKAIGKLTLTSSDEIVRDNPYNILVRATYTSSNAEYHKDINYLFYTKDVELEIPLILGTESTLTAKQLYPNPVKDFLKVDLPDTRNFSIVILNQQGARIQQQSLSLDNTIDLRSLPAGFYIFEVRQMNRPVLRTKIIKE